MTTDTFNIRFFACGETHVYAVTIKTYALYGRLIRIYHTTGRPFPDLVGSTQVTCFEDRHVGMFYVGDRSKALIEV